MKTYSSDEATMIAGCTKRQLEYWQKRRFIVPLRGGGSGRYFQWSSAEVVRIQRIRQRLDWGLTLEAAVRVKDPGPVPPPTGGDQ